MKYWFIRIYKKIRLWNLLRKATYHVCIDPASPNSDFSSYVIFKRLRDGTMIIEEWATYNTGFDRNMRDLK